MYVILLTELLIAGSISSFLFLFLNIKIEPWSCSFQLGPKFMKENGLKHVTFSTADGALEAAPAVRDSLCFHQKNSYNFSIYYVVTLYFSLIGETCSVAHYSCR